MSSLLLSYSILYFFFKLSHNLKVNMVTATPGDGGGGTPLYGLYRYVRPQRVGFFSRFGHK